MKAVGLRLSLPITEKESLIEFELDKPIPHGHDILVNVKAISVNPVDYKVRMGSTKDIPLETPKILGWDAAGVVEAVGPEVTLFKPGDEVYYAGDLKRPGSNAEYQLVDERIVGRKPNNLSFAQAAALPLTLLTAWELMFDRMNIQRNSGQHQRALIISGAGGVGSIAIQLFKQLTAMQVIATASRKESIDWCKQMGADQIITPNQLLNTADDIPSIDVILNLTNTDQYWQAMGELIQPQGKLGCIVPPKKEMAIGSLFNKSASIHWELMFTRSSYQTSDMIRQHNILSEAAKLLEQGVLKSTVNKVYQGLTADNLKTVHSILESGKAVGKMVIEL